MEDIMELAKLDPREVFPFETEPFYEQIPASVPPTVVDEDLPF